jgi:SAM-dependent methyltransferase
MSKDLSEVARETYPECFGHNPLSFNDEHLGGTNTQGDPATYYHPHVWGYLFKQFNIKSMVDIGCGFGYAIKFIKEKFPDVEVLGVEGSKKVVNLCLFPKQTLQHDYCSGPLKLSTSYDLGWSTEFVEHVEEKYVPNFIETFKCCKYVAFTYASPGQGGHHHVNENTKEYWIDTMQNNGFEYLYDENQVLKEEAQKDMNELRTFDSNFYIFHFHERGLFFKNTLL